MLVGIAHVVRTSASAEDVVFATSLLSTLTLSNDRVVSSRAGAVLRELATRSQDSSIPCPTEETAAPG